MSLETESRSPALPETAPVAAQASRSRPVWRAEPLVRWPAQVTVLGVLAIAAFLWLAAELVWRTPDVSTLDVPKAIGQPGGAVRARQSVDTSTFVQTFGSRKLFIPVVPVEQSELSGEVVDEMLSRMKLASVFRDGEDLVAMVDVRQRDVSASQLGRGSAGSASSSYVTSLTVRKGDRLLDFQVVDVTPDGLDLSIAGFRRKLTY